MQRFPNDSPRPDGSFWKSWTFAALAVQAAVIVALVGLALQYPGASKWISQAVDAEFAHATPPQDAPTQLANPGEKIRTVRAN